MAFDKKTLEALEGVTTATLTTVLLKKGLRNVWLRGAKPLRPGQARVAGPAFTLRFVPMREDLATPASWNSPVSTRAAIEAIEAAGSPVTGLLVDYHLDRGNGIAAIRDVRRRFGEAIPAILITAARSPHVRAAASEENIAVLNKPVKPASLRALLGQWRTQQMVAAE